ncbi:Uncharacterised protein [Pandoraea pulmonicola]|uniref:Uncharacterized protein n=1 Tax=Pandoraea pulmonicola TaxID=93221 RepID=A0AAJ5D1Q9_PANPU|nr:Uncharacterised protein [Pandoraea pulmonicola]
MEAVFICSANRSLGWHDQLPFAVTDVPASHLLIGVTEPVFRRSQNYLTNRGLPPRFGEYRM